MSEPALQFDRVGKRFSRGAGHDSLRDLLGSAARRLMGRGACDGHREPFWALRNVTFEALRGEALGIIGPNGAGKSTALKLLAGILRPDEGRVEVRGRLAALIEVGAGFHGDLTGRENVYLHGAILGMSRRQVRSRFDDIVAFAGVGDFLDMPVKRYSSGMYARLGFAVAAHVDPDVLLVDEVLSVGDAVFRLRCMERMRELLARGTTLVFVTHQLDQMQMTCTRALVLDRGTACGPMPAGQAIARYHQAMTAAHMAHRPDLECPAAAERVQLVALRFLDERGSPVTWAEARRELCIEAQLRIRDAIPHAVVELNLRRFAHENLLSFNSGRAAQPLRLEPGIQRVRVRTRGLPLCGGQYFCNVRVWDAERLVNELDTPFAHSLVIQDSPKTTGLVEVEHTWETGGREPARSEVEREAVAASASDLSPPTTDPSRVALEAGA